MLLWVIFEISVQYVYLLFAGRYTPAQQGSAYNSGAKQRVIRMVEMQKDPLEPPKFKTNKKIPRGPPSPPAPVMHSPPRKVTVKEQQEWKIPPCISNWKNPKVIYVQQLYAVIILLYKYPAIRLS